MKNFCKSCIFITALLFSQVSANALDVLFPQKNPYSTKADETYIMGSVAKGASLVINGNKVKVWHNGAFCYPVKLSEGENIFILKEHDFKDDCEQTVKITKPQSKLQTSSPSKYVAPKTVIFKELQYATVITDGAPVRAKASTYGERISHLPKNTIVLLEQKCGDWYKIFTGDKCEPLWIFSGNVKINYPVNNRPKVSIRNVEISEDTLFSYLKLKLDIPVAYKLTEKGKNVELTIFGINNFQMLCEKINSQKVFENIDVVKNEYDNLVIKLNSSENIWGYDACYDGCTLVFKKRKTPDINISAPLKGITISVDAGHGGKEKGTVGPTRIPEKEVNLSISKFLKSELEKRGATVVMTREDDSFVDLYARPEIANKNKALISLSIHANSILDGNPLEKHGVSVFYYNEHAKMLADTIKTRMVKDLKLQDDGTRQSSFVLTRPTMPISILVEVAYMPNPDEYLKLTNRHFQYKTARTIAESVEEYIKNR